MLNQQNAHANLNAANSEIALAQKDLERYENLYQAGAVSKQTLDRARTNLESVQAKQTTAEQSIFSKDPSKSAKVADADLNVLKAQNVLQNWLLSILILKRLLMELFQIKS